MQPKNDRPVQRVFLALLLSVVSCTFFTADVVHASDKKGKQSKPTTSAPKATPPRPSAPKAAPPKASPPKASPSRPTPPRTTSPPKAKAPNRPQAPKRPAVTTPTRSNPTRFVFPSRPSRTKSPDTNPGTRTPGFTIPRTPGSVTPATPDARGPKTGGTKGSDSASTLARKKELDAILTRINGGGKPTSTSLPKPNPDTDSSGSDAPITIPDGTEIPEGHGEDGDHDHGHDEHHHHGECWTPCSGDGFNFWFRFGSPFWGGCGWGFGFVDGCGWWWWANDGYCAPWWYSPWSTYCWWYPSPYWGWYPNWSSSTTVIVQQPVIVNQQTSTTLIAGSPPMTTMSQGDTVVVERADGSIVIASASQAWLYLGYGDPELAAELFAALLEKQPDATDYLLGYTLALASTGDRGQVQLAALALEEVLRLDAGVLLSVPMDEQLRERMTALKLQLLLQSRGIDVDSGTIMLLAAVRTVLGEHASALSALRVAEDLFGQTPGSESLRRLLEMLRESDLLSMR